MHSCHVLVVMLRKVVAITTLAASTAACSSAYIPQRGPHVSIVMEGGSLSYVRDGKTYEGGVFGGDIDEAVKGQPAAEEYARQYKNGMTVGFALSMFGIGGMLGGAAITGAESRGNSDVPVTGLAVLGAGLVLDLVGAFVMMAAVPHLYDAVNAYNDGIAGSADAPAPAPSR
jgi:hypothetical protein